MKAEHVNAKRLRVEHAIALCVAFVKFLFVPMIISKHTEQLVFPFVNLLSMQNPNTPYTLATERKITKLFNPHLNFNNVNILCLSENTLESSRGTKGNPAIIKTCQQDVKN